MPADPTSGCRRPLLSLVVDRAATRHPLAGAVESAVRAGVDQVQIRDRVLDGRALLRWARELAAAATRGAAARNDAVSIVVNRRVDIALAIGADGVHLGFDAMSPADARRVLQRFAGNDTIAGCSLHAVSEVEEAAAAGATYAHLAPIWDPKSKPATRSALGTDALARACGRGVTILAQGGVTSARCAEVLGAGAAGVAVTGAILMADDPAEAATALREALDQAARGFATVEDRS